MKLFHLSHLSLHYWRRAATMEPLIKLKCIHLEAFSGDLQNIFLEDSCRDDKVSGHVPNVLLLFSQHSLLSLCFVCSDYNYERFDTLFVLSLTFWTEKLLLFETIDLLCTAIGYSMPFESEGLCHCCEWL